MCDISEEDIERFRKIAVDFLTRLGEPNMPAFPIKTIGTDFWQVNAERGDTRFELIIGDDGQIRRVTPVRQHIRQIIEEPIQIHENLAARRTTTRDFLVTNRKKAKLYSILHIASMVVAYIFGMDDPFNLPISLTVSFVLGGTPWIFESVKYIERRPITYEL